MPVKKLEFLTIVKFSQGIELQLLPIYSNISPVVVLKLL
jgi:hypothetical protein